MASNLDPLGLKAGYFHAAITHATKTATKEDQSVIEKFQSIYCGNIGYEMAHIQNAEEYQWLCDKIESDAFSLTQEEKVNAYEQMYRAEHFEQTLHKKFPGAKRFSVEGAEGTIVALESIMLEASNNGVQEVVLGMAHRGRLNVLVHTTGKPYHAVFSEFAGVSSIPAGTPGSGCKIPPWLFTQ